MISMAMTIEKYLETKRPLDAYILQNADDVRTTLFMDAFNAKGKLVPTNRLEHEGLLKDIDFSAHKTENIQGVGGSNSISAQFSLASSRNVNHLANYVEKTPLSMIYTPGSQEALDIGKAHLMKIKSDVDYFGYYGQYDALSPNPQQDGMFHNPLIAHENVVKSTLSWETLLDLIIKTKNVNTMYINDTTAVDIEKALKVNVTTSLNAPAEINLTSNIIKAFGRTIKIKPDSNLKDGDFVLGNDKALSVPALYVPTILPTKTDTQIIEISTHAVLCLFVELPSNFRTVTLTTV
jgi:hypothetical protein